MKYRIQLDVVVDSELNAIEVLNGVEFLKRLVCNPRNMKGVTSDRKCLCTKENAGNSELYDEVNFDGPRKMHNPKGADKIGIGS